MRVYGVQVDCVWEDAGGSCERAAGLLRAERPEAGALVALPEMFGTGFSMNSAATVDRNGSTQAFLASLARDYSCTVVGGVVAAGADGRPRNQAVVYGPDGAEAARYSKIQPFAPGGEALHYASGDEVVVFDWWSGAKPVRVALFVCYDLRFPEHFRVAVRRGAELYVVIASWPEARESHWVKLLQARAIENQAYVLGVNRCGADPSFRYPGRSLVVDYSGEVIADAGAGEGVVSAELDFAALRAYRAKLPFLRDMRG